MDLIRRRAVLGWAIGAVAVVGLYVWAVASRPTIEGASAGVVSRVGFLAAVVALPMLLASRTISKFTVDNAVGAVLLPAVLGVVVGILVVVLGFTPEDARVCAGLARHDLVNPACYTSTATRVAVLAEGLVSWLVFGALLIGLIELRRRSQRRRADRRQATARPG